MSRITPAGEQPLGRDRILSHVPALPAAQQALAAALDGRLDPLLAATATAVVLRRSPYELAVAMPGARAAGLTDEMFEAIEDEDWTDPSFSDAQKAVFRFALIFDGGHGMPDADFDRVREHLDETETVALAALCAHAGSLARLAIALSYPPDQEE